MSHLCMIFEATGPYNAIGKIAMAQVEAALDAGWRVSVVAKRLDEGLQRRVEWLRLYVPPRGFALQWLTARHFIRKALGDPGRFDVIHGHQPQIADLCHVFQCHFLTRVAHELDCLTDGHGTRRLVAAAQNRIVLAAEDRCYDRWNPATRMLFNSDLTRQHFARLYGLPPLHETLTYPSPPLRLASPDDRRAARRRWLGRDHDGIVAGFLGGLHARKGYRELIAALRGHNDLFLLMGGMHSEGFAPAELDGHFKSVGMCTDPASFYTACDVLLVPSHFETFGYVASESAAVGTPVIATPGVGALPHLIEHGAGRAWLPGSSLAEVIRSVVSREAEYRVGCTRYTAAYSSNAHDRRLLDLYSSVASAEPRSRSPRESSPAVAARTL